MSTERDFKQVRGSIESITRFNFKNTNKVVITTEKGNEFVGYCSDLVLETALTTKRLSIDAESFDRIGTQGTIVNLSYEFNAAGSTYVAANDNPKKGVKKGDVVARTEDSNSIGTISIEKLAPQSLNEMIAANVGREMAKALLASSSVAAARPEFKPVSKRADDFEQESLAAPTPEVVTPTKVVGKAAEVVASNA